MAKRKVNPDMTEGSPAEEASESKATEAAEVRAGQDDHPVVHRPRSSTSPYPV